MKKAVVVGVDGSPESLAAADWAAREAALRGLPLRIVHAWLWQPLDIPLVQNRETEAQAARAVLREAEDQVVGRYPELPVSCRVLPETAVVALLAEAERSELLCLGTRGHGALLGFLLGSYGQQVIAGAKGPVVSVRAYDGEYPVRENGEVVVGQQGSPEESADVLGFAFEAASVRGSRCGRSAPGACRPSTPGAPPWPSPTPPEGWSPSSARRSGRPWPPGARSTRRCRSRSTWRWAAPGRYWSRSPPRHS